ncbi:MAG: terminase family protein [Bryobacteraceae bacterium]
MRLDAAWVRSKNADEPGFTDRFLGGLTEKELRVLQYNWHGFWARDAQLPPKEPFSIWLIQAGRGFGKTRVLAEEIIAWAQKSPGEIAHVVGRTAAEVRDVLVIGPAGILAHCPPWFKPKHRKQERRIDFPNGARVFLFSAEEPDQLRGPQCHIAFADELAAWASVDTLSNLRLGLRLGKKPRLIVATTPRKTKVFLALLDLIKKLPAQRCVVTRGSTLDNRDNLAEEYIEDIIATYEGTRLGRQELYGELLDDNPRALWSRELIDSTRLLRPDPSDPVVRIVVAVDPSVADGTEEAHAECGIVVCGLTSKKRMLVLEDASMKGPPTKWAEAVTVAAFKWTANYVVAEANNGGELVRTNILAVAGPQLKVKKVNASMGKVPRAEPISSLYEQGRVSHVGTHIHLENQMCEWEPPTGQNDRREGKLRSPDRMDALVWAGTELMLGGKQGGGFSMS